MSNLSKRKELAAKEFVRERKKRRAERELKRELITVKPKTAKGKHLKTIANNPQITARRFAQIRKLSEDSAKTTLWRLKTKNLIKSEAVNRIGTLGYTITEKGKQQLKKLVQKRAVKPIKREAAQPLKKVAIERPKSRGGRPRKKIDVRKVVELKQKGLSNRNIAKIVGGTHPTIRKILNEQQKPS